MDQVIVYVNDAPHARRQLAATRLGPTHWVLVACPPRMSQRIGRWLNHSAREKWQRQWSARLFGQLLPPLQAGGDRVSPVVAKAPLPALTRELSAVHGPCRVLDARRPRPGRDLPPLTDAQPALP